MRQLFEYANRENLAPETSFRQALWLWCWRLWRPDPRYFFYTSSRYSALFRHISSRTKLGEAWRQEALCPALGNKKPGQWPGFAWLLSGEGRIRTDGGLAPTLVFKTRAINHSTTSPGSFNILSSHLNDAWSSPNLSQDDWVVVPFVR